MKRSLRNERFSLLVLSLAILLGLAAALVCVPARAAARQPVPAASSRNPARNPAISETPKSEEEQMRGFLHAPAVHSLARWLHLDVDTTSEIFVIVNFVIIILAIVIPLTRIMPRVMRGRSLSLQERLKVAREATEDANKRLSAVEARLAGLGDDIQKFRAQIEQESLEDEKRIKTALAEESARIMAASEQEIGAAVAHARRGLRNFAAGLAVEQAAKQLQLSAQTDSEIIREFIGSLSAEGGAAANGSKAVSGGSKIDSKIGSRTGSRNGGQR